MPTYTPDTLIKELYGTQPAPTGMMSQDQLMTSLAGKTIAPTQVRYNRGVETQAPGLPVGGVKSPTVASVGTTPITVPTTPVTTPTVPNTQNTPTVPTGGYSIYTGGSAVDDGKGAIGYRDAQGNVKYFRDNTTPTTESTPTVGATTIPGATPQKSAYDYQKEAYDRLYPEYSGAIDAITQNYTRLINEAKQQGVQNQGANRALGAAYGLMGSPDQTTNDMNIGKATDNAIGKLNSARAIEISNIIEKIHNNAAEIAKEQSRMDEKGATDKIAYMDKLKKESEDHISAFAAQGISASKLKEKSPETYANLLKQSGLDDNTLAAMFALKTPANNVLNKQVVGSTYYQTVQAPDGTVTTQNFDLGFTPPVDYSMNVDTKNGTIVWYPKQPDPNKDIQSQIIVKKYGVPGVSGAGVGGTYQIGSNPIVDAWASRINSGQAKLSDITGAANIGLKNDVVRALNSMSGGRLSAVQNNIVEAKKLVDELITDPGREASTGIPNLLTNPLGFSIAATDARGFKAKVERLNALLFLNAIPQMKGMGALTEREGSRIESASSFTRNMGVDEQTYLNELKRLQKQLDSSYKAIGGGVSGETQSTGGTAQDTTVVAPDGTEVIITD